MPEPNGALGTENANPFEYTHLLDVDPDFKPIDEAVYTLKVIKLEYRTPKNGGDVYISGQFAVSDPGGKANGRRLFERIFYNDFGKRTLRKLMDFTAVRQDPTESLGSWMEKMSEVQPEFKILVKKGLDVDYKTGQPRLDPNGQQYEINTLSWRDIAPAV